MPPAAFSAFAAAFFASGPSRLELLRLRTGTPRVLPVEPEVVRDRSSAVRSGLPPCFNRLEAGWLGDC